MRRISGQKEVIQTKSKRNVLFILIFLFSILSIAGLIIYTIIKL